MSGPRVQLRPWQLDDAARVAQVLGTPEMREFLMLPEPFDTDAAQRWIQRRRTDDGLHLDRAVIERASGRVVGSAGLWLPGDPIVGYWMAPDARGHGYAAEAAHVLAGWVFDQGAPRVVLSCDVRNLPSVRTALTAGFRFEGTARAQFLGGGEEPGTARQADAARFARLADDPVGPVAPAFAPLPPSGLSDGVIALRPARAEDGPSFFETEDELAAGWSFDGRRPTLEQADGVMTRAGLHWLVGPSARCAIVDIASGAYAGDLQIRLEGPPGVAGLGYTVHPAFRGRGYTTRALRLLVPWAFEIAGFARLELGAKQPNIASQRAALSAGFQPDGVRRGRLRNPDGTFADEVCFALENPALSPA